jgi:hypothetical protein
MACRAADSTKEAKDFASTSSVVPLIWLICLILLLLLILLRSFVVRCVTAGHATGGGTENPVTGRVTGDPTDDGSLDAPLCLCRGDAGCECKCTVDDYLPHGGPPLRLRCGAVNSRIRLASFWASAGLEFDHYQAAQTLPVHRKHQRAWRMLVLATHTPLTDVLPGPQPKALPSPCCPAEQLVQRLFNRQ